MLRLIRLGKLFLLIIIVWLYFLLPLARCGDMVQHPCMCGPRPDFVLLCDNLFSYFLYHPYILTIFVENFYCSLVYNNPLGLLYVEVIHDVCCIAMMSKYASNWSRLHNNCIHDRYFWWVITVSSIPVSVSGVVNRHCWSNFALNE